MLQILVIDDDVELCELVAEYLEPDGYKVEAVHDGQTGLERALSGDHALAVLDYMLPGLNGFELLGSPGSWRHRDGSSNANCKARW
jgi:two-component system response regulator CpxR